MGGLCSVTCPGIDSSGMLPVIRVNGRVGIDSVRLKRCTHPSTTGPGTKRNTMRKRVNVKTYVTRKNVKPGSLLFCRKWIMSRARAVLFIHGTGTRITGAGTSSGPGAELPHAVVNPLIE